MKSQETYQQFCARTQLSPGPEAAIACADDALAVTEIKRYYDDQFLTSMHPDGSNLAGFHGVGTSEDAQ